MTHAVSQHPGHIVRDLIDEAGWTMGEAAAALGVSRQHLTRIVAGQSGISAEMALRLETVFGSTAELWLRLQDRWDLARVRERAADITRGLKRAEPA